MQPQGERGGLPSRPAEPHDTLVQATTPEAARVELLSNGTTDGTEDGLVSSAFPALHPTLAASVEQHTEHETVEKDGEEIVDGQQQQEQQQQESQQPVEEGPRAPQGAMSALEAAPAQDVSDGLASGGVDMSVGQQQEVQQWQDCQREEGGGSVQRQHTQQPQQEVDEGPREQHQHPHEAPALHDAHPRLAELHVNVQGTTQSYICPTTVAEDQAPTAAVTRVGDSEAYVDTAVTEVLTPGTDTPSSVQQVESVQVAVTLTEPDTTLFSELHDGSAVVIEEAVSTPPDMTESLEQEGSTFAPMTTITELPGLVPCTAADAAPASPLERSSGGPLEDSTSEATMDESLLILQPPLLATPPEPVVPASATGAVASVMGSDAGQLDASVAEDGVGTEQLAEIKAEESSAQLHAPLTLADPPPPPPTIEPPTSDMQPSHVSGMLMVDDTDFDINGSSSGSSDAHVVEINTLPPPPPPSSAPLSPSTRERMTRPLPILTSPTHAPASMTHVLHAADGAVRGNIHAPAADAVDEDQATPIRAAPSARASLSSSPSHSARGQVKQGSHCGATAHVPVRAKGPGTPVERKRWDSSTTAWPAGPTSLDSPLTPPFQRSLHAESPRHSGGSPHGTRNTGSPSRTYLAATTASIERKKQVKEALEARKASHAHSPTHGGRFKPHVHGDGLPAAKALPPGAK